MFECGKVVFIDKNLFDIVLFVIMFVFVWLWCVIDKVVDWIMFFKGVFCDWIRDKFLGMGYVIFGNWVEGVV